MITVTVEKECGCFKRNEMVNNQTFPTMEAAKSAAENMVEEMNETWCGKHNFEAIEKDNKITIKFV